MLWYKLLQNEYNLLFILISVVKTIVLFRYEKEHK